MSGLQHRWDEGAPQREKRRAAGGRLAGLGWMLLAVVILLVAAGLTGLVVWGIAASGAWKPLLGFVIAATVIAAISLGIRRR